MFGSGKAKTREMVILLVDHLDKVLEAGERLTEFSLTLKPISSAMTPDDILNEHARLRDFIEGVRALEMTLAARVDKARNWAREIKNRDSNLKLMASLFASGTQALADAMEELGDPRLQDFNGGEEALYFLRLRSLVPEHVHSIDELPVIRVTADYTLLGCIKLEPLLDLVATFIDTLDVHYGILGEAEDDAVATVSAQAH